MRRRLQRAGLAADVDRFRAEQVLWGAVGAGRPASSSALASWLGTAAAPCAAASLLVALCGAGAGVVGPRPVAQPRRRTAASSGCWPSSPPSPSCSRSPSAPGEGAVGALERVCRLSHGELAGELRRCLADARAGANLPTALQGLADRTGLTSLRRFVDGIVVAVERGTPLADVLRAQAQDVREAGRRAVMEEGGKKEIAMMVPVVFLVLPVTVLFAVYPGFTFLRFSI